ncbi:MAG: hypothetical protein FJW37_04565 [Acidobacteria bacterium]|nr:hypothetical protein [Acidobacteriota bacterium]
MPEQILLQGRIAGIRDFLSARGAQGTRVAGGGEPESFAAAAQWVGLLSEVVPRALLAELGLPRVLLGSSGGGQFLLVLPGDAGPAAGQLLAEVARHVAELTQGVLRPLWSITENLGDWAAVRRRLNEELERRRGTPLAGAGGNPFEPLSAPAAAAGELFSGDTGFREAASAGWSPEAPAAIRLGGGKHQWSLTPNLSADGITVARHVALGEDGKTPAGLQTLARRAQGRSVWGVLRADVDDFGVRLRRLQSIEEHVSLSVLYRNFFAGELEALCSLPEFWRKVSILYSGGNDFAVYGSWDALILLAREIERVFHRFTEESLKEFPGAEGKTLSMALALAPAPQATLAGVFDEAGRNLDVAKTSGKDSMHLFGRSIEWKRLGDAAEIKDSIGRFASDHRAARQLLADLRRFFDRGSRRAEGETASAWQLERRFSRILSGARQREFQKLRGQLVREMMDRSAPEARLRPAGMVAVEWARLAND